VIVENSRTMKDARCRGVGSCHWREARRYQLEEKCVRRKTDCSARSDLIEAAALADEAQEPQVLAVGSQHTQQVGKSGHTVGMQKTMIDVDLTAGDPAFVVRCNLVEVHISSRPYHLPFEQWLVRLPSRAEV
jgi:hypothetical protein